ncbi:abortive phage infection protein [Bacillus cytotoxicus]|uniref:Abortive phage infection protein n=1 Tax=Bacillus cytotoxicus TaxID=580165 RepID=A0ACC6A2C3_9BACI|nr:abortive phage infection protein [Bacillus cytotoxicus]HDX9580753.1 abortive phage infection protein [Bacillus pseudomycoides]
MDKQQVNIILDQLKNNEIQEYIVTKEVFYTFREVLVEREDFKHFRGNAQHGAKIIYTYMEMPRS